MNNNNILLGQSSMILLGANEEIPTATDVAINNLTPSVGDALTASYTYNANDGGSEGTSTYRWLRDNVAIGSATDITYTPVTADVGTALKFEVIPIGATLTGLATQSTSTSDVARIYKVKVTDSSTQSTSSSTVTIPLEVIAGTGRAAIVQITCRTDGTINVPTFDGDNMTLISSSTETLGGGTPTYVNTYMMLDTDLPSTEGAFDLVASATSGDLVVRAEMLLEVAQVIPTGSAISNAANGSRFNSDVDTLDLTPTIVADNSYVLAGYFFSNLGASIASSTSDYLLINNENNFFTQYHARISRVNTPIGTPTLNITMTNDIENITGSAIVFASGAGGFTDPVEQMLATIADFGYYAKAAFSNTTLRTKITADGTVIEGFKVRGTNRLISQEADAERTTDNFTSDTWYNADGAIGSEFRIFSGENGVAYLQNGQPTGFYGGNVDLGNVDVDIIFSFRHWAGIASTETVFSVGSFGVKFLDNGVKVVSASSYEYDATDSNDVIPYAVFSIFRLRRTASSGDWELYLNNVLIASDTDTDTFSLAGFTIGTISHVSELDFAMQAVKAGGFFTSDEVTEILAVSETAYPRGVLPDFPYLDDCITTVGSDFNSTTKVWDFGNGAFTGGNGSAGTHTYQWYYYNSDDGSLGILDENFPISGATSKSLDRNDHKGVGEIFNGHEGDNFNTIFRVTIPVDSAGTTGKAIASKVLQDNVV